MQQLIDLTKAKRRWTEKKFLSVMLMKEVWYFLTILTRAIEALRDSARPGRSHASDAKTHWHKDKARLTGTRNCIMLLLKSQQG